MKSKLPRAERKRRGKTIVTQLSKKPSAAEFKLRLRERFWMRLHMALMLLGVIWAGVGFSKLLLALGVKAMAVRYPAAIIVSYGVFFLLVKLWLWYVGIYARRPARSATRGGKRGLDLSGADFSPSSSSSGSADWGGFSGGSSGGGGASDSWGTSFSSSSGGSSTESLLDFGFDWGDDEGGCLSTILLLLLLGVAIVLLGWGLGGGIYLIYQAPAILVEAAFEAALAAGLVRATRGMGGGDWRRRLFKATWKQVLGLLLLALGVGWAAQHWCPAAVKLADLWRAC